MIQPASPRWRTAISRAAAPRQAAEPRKAPESEPLAGTIGIGHTRWATHGKPNENNAHPHATDRVAVVHNGIIENFRELRERAAGRRATSSRPRPTREVVAHLVTRRNEARAGRRPTAVAAALPRLRGAFALAFLFEGEDDLLIGARKGSPLAVGYGDGEMYLGSDAIALAPFTDTISYLEEGDWAVLSRERRAGSRRRRQQGDARRAEIQRVRRSWSTRATIATSWRRKSTSSRKWSATRWRTISTWRPSGCAAGAAVRLRASIEPHVDLRLRHRLLCRAGRQILVRALCAAAGRDRCRVRVPLPRGAVRRRAALRSSSRSRARPPTRSRRCATPRSRSSTSLSVVNVRDLDDRARKRRGDADARRAGDRRRLDQGVHLPAGGARLPRDRGGTRARRAVDEDDERKLVRALIEVPRLMAEALQLEPQIEQLARDLSKMPRRALSRPRHELSARARRRAEAEGNLLHPRRRLCRRRAQARADRADRREHAGDRDRAATTACSRRPSPTCRRSRRAAAGSS